jgi:hypothetical protein
MVGSYSSTKWFWISWMVRADLPTPPATHYIDHIKKIIVLIQKKTPEFSSVLDLSSGSSDVVPVRKCIISDIKQNPRNRTFNNNKNTNLGYRDWRHVANKIKCPYLTGDFSTVTSTLKKISDSHQCFTALKVSLEKIYAYPQSNNL